MLQWLRNHVKELVALALLLLAVIAAMVGINYQVPVLAAGAYALIATLIVTFTVEPIATASTREHMRELLGIVQGAIEGGIINMYGQRHQNDRADADIFSTLQSALCNEEKVFLVAVAAPHTFPLKTQQLIMQYKGYPKMKVILLDQYSPWADERAEMEDPHDTKEDIRASERFLKAAQIRSGKLGMPPVAFLLGTRKVLFVQPYPLVDRDTLRKLDPSLVGKAIGGTSPMIQIRGGTPAHHLWYSHFEYLWKNDSLGWEDIWT